MRPNLLDFTPDGQAIINMPNFKQISFLENFGFSPIESVEQEISQADCAERAAFLEHYVKVFKETYTEDPYNMLPAPDEEDEDEFERLTEHSVCFRNTQLLHTTAWYMFNHIPSEIEGTKRHLEELHGMVKAEGMFDDVVRIIRHSETAIEARNKLQRQLGFSFIQARRIMSLSLSELSESKILKGSELIERYRKRLEFLLKLQPNGVMGAMYFDKKGIPFHLS